MKLPVFLHVYSLFTIIFVISLLMCSTSYGQTNESNNNYNMFWTEVYPDVDGKTQLLGWFMEVKPDGLTWDLIVSSEDWFQLDVGYTHILGNWSISGLIGSDMTISKIELGSVIPQLYFLYYNANTKLRYQSWNLGFLSDQTLVRLRNFLTYKGLGLDTDIMLVKGSKPGIKFGPMFEIKFNQWTLLPEVLFDSSGNSSFKLSLFREWF